MTGGFKMANWIGYMDWDENGNSALARPVPGRDGHRHRLPGGGRTTTRSSSSSQLQGPLQAGLPTGWDLVVLTDWMIQRLVAYGWLEPFDTAATPNYPANLLTIYQNRDWDPGNLLAAP